jgi:prepilin peptidase CpaA
MMEPASLITSLIDNWPIWLVSVTLVVAAIIDGWMLKVPNWITFPMIVSGWIYSSVIGGWEGFGWSLLGSFVGLMLLYILYSVGGMGAGDVKLLAGIGAWVHTDHTLNVFIATTIVGALMALIMVAWSGQWRHHARQFVMIIREFWDVCDAEQLYQRAAARKPTMRLLPYGIPMTIAALGYFAYQGMYF